MRGNTHQPLSHGLASFLGVIDVAASLGGRSLYAAEESGMPCYTGCARRASTDGRYICLNRECGGLRKYNNSQQFTLAVILWFVKSTMRVIVASNLLRPQA